MADYPCRELGGRTPLEAAGAPNLRALARASALGRVRVSARPVFSDNAFLSILGYGEQEYPGRGPLEALAAGVRFSGNDLVARCNLVSEENGRVGEYLNDLTKEETRAFIKAVNGIAKPLGADFVHGSGYKHLLVLRNAGGEGVGLVPPVQGERVERVFAAGRGKTAALLNRLVRESQRIFSTHPANASRARAGKKLVHSVWFWGAGRLEKTIGLKERYGVDAAVVSAVNVVKGIGKWLGARVVEVPGATGYYDTNYGGKADAAVKALGENDFVIVHVQAPDQAGHEGDARMKVRAIEDFDKRVVGKCLRALRKKGLAEHCRIAVVPDHFTPVRLRQHAADPVPFLLYRPGARGEGAREYSEMVARKGSLGLVDGKRFMQLFFGPALEAKAVFFDLWGTLLTSSKKQEYEEVKRVLGLRMSYGQYLGMQEKHWFTSPEMSEEEYFGFFCKKAGGPGKDTVQRLAGVWRKWRDSMKLFPEVPGVLGELGKKYRLVIVSNTEPPAREVVEVHGLKKFFSAAVYSCDSGCLKPDSHIFLEAARRLGAKPGECVMVGNNLVDDVAGAKKAGMKAVWVNRRGGAVSAKADAVVEDLAELVEKKIL